MSESAPTDGPCIQVPTGIWLDLDERAPSGEGKAYLAICDALCNVIPNDRLDEVVGRIHDALIALALPTTEAAARAAPEWTK